MNLVYPAEIIPSHGQAPLDRLFDKDPVKMPLEGGIRLLYSPTRE